MIPSGQTYAFHLKNKNNLWNGGTRKISHSFLNVLATILHKRLALKFNYKTHTHKHKHTLELIKITDMPALVSFKWERDDV